MIGRAGVTACAVLCIAGPGLAQDDFVELYERAQKLSAEKKPEGVVRAAYARSVRAFEDLDREVDGYYSHLPAAGYAAWRSGEYARAAQWFRIAIDATGPTEFLVRSEIDALVRDKRGARALRVAYDHADAGFASAVDAVAGGTNGFGLQPLFEAADAAMRRGDTELGLWYFRTIARTSGEAAIALGNLALSLRCVGRVEEAEAMYRKAIQKAPTDAYLWNDLGLLLKGLGRRKEAHAAFRKSREAETPPVAGPATGNLIDLIPFGFDPGFGDPEAALAVVLTELPDAQLSRRRCIDAILGR